MQLEKIPFSSIANLSRTDIAYQNQEQALQPFFKYPVTIDSFKQIIHDKSEEEIDRQLLHDVLIEQYAQLRLDLPQGVPDILDSNTFTVVTAHQPALYTGPLYFMIKIASTIHLAKTLSIKLQRKILPIFILGGEDHDFEEVNHMRLFGKEIVWQSNQTGSVGRMHLEGFNDTVGELFEILGSSEQAEALKTMIRYSLEGSSSYGEVMKKFVYQLFKHTNLIILGMDHPALKNRFKEVMRAELFNQVSYQIVPKTQERIEKAGFNSQAFVRKINLFYLQDQKRSRIEFDGNRYTILDSELSFSKEEIESELDQHPERFSPNVIMRPLYQETILPNLAYIGGGGELAYWLERKEQFEHFQLNFPMLIRRNSILWINKGMYNQMSKFDIQISDLFFDTEEMVKKWIDANTEVDLQVEDERKMIEEAYSLLESKSKSIDPTLLKVVSAEKVKNLKQFEQLGGRLMRAQKQRFEQSVNKLRKVKEKLFPKGGLQERHDNFMSFYLQYGPTFIDTLIDHLNPLEKDFFVFVDKD